MQTYVSPRESSVDTLDGDRPLPQLLPVSFLDGMRLGHELVGYPEVQVVVLEVLEKVVQRVLVGYYVFVRSVPFDNVIILVRAGKTVRILQPLVETVDIGYLVVRDMAEIDMDYRPVYPGMQFAYLRKICALPADSKEPVVLERGETDENSTVGFYARLERIEEPDMVHNVDQQVRQFISIRYVPVQ